MWQKKKKKKKKHLPQLFHKVVGRSTLECAKVLCELHGFRKVASYVCGSPRCLAHFFPSLPERLLPRLSVSPSSWWHLGPQWDVKGREAMRVKSGSQDPWRGAFGADSHPDAPQPALQRRPVPPSQASLCCGLRLLLQAWARPAASQAIGFPRPPFPLTLLEPR